MKNKTFKHGKLSYKTYIKNAGHGFEVGIVNKGKPLFVGNFLKSTQANEFYSLINREILKFGNKFWATDKTNKSFYTKFLSNHTYTIYYKFINKIVPKLNKVYDRELNKNIRTYKKLKNNWEPSEKIPMKRAA